MNLKRHSRYLLVLVSAFASTPLFAAEPADTAYTNGKIYTVNERSAWAEAVAIKDGKFIPVPSNESWYQGLTKGLEELRAVGTTSITDAKVSPGALIGYRRLEDEGKLNIPVQTCFRSSA